MRFLLDMGLSVHLASWLREQNHDAVHLRDQGLQRLPDVDILSKARQEDRIVLTLDLDFGFLLAISGETLPGVVIFRMGIDLPEQAALAVMRSMSKKPAERFSTAGR